MLCVGRAWGAYYLETVMASKHYYMGGQRIATNLISYAFDHDNPELELIQAPNETDTGYTALGTGAPQDLMATLDCLYGEPQNYTTDFLYLQSIGQEMEFVDCNATVGEPGEGTSSLEEPLCACEQSVYFANLNEANCDELEIIYFYHPDYLGSTEFITDMRGEPYQPVRRSLGEGGFFLNTPWCENLENQYAKSYTSFSSRFRFNGKEWDEETGNYYYGARYYDPKVNVWLSVDPLARKYPELSPYTYVANNPINLVDPDGRDIWRVKNGRLTLYKKTGDNYNVFQNAKGTEVFRTNQQVNWNNQDRPINENVKDYKQIVGLIANDRTSQNRMKDRANETGWDDSQFYSAGEFVDRMKTQAESQKKADAIGLGKDAVLTVVVPGGVPFLDDAALIEQWNELINNGETIPETMMRNGQQAIDNGQSFWSDLKYSVKSTINNIENAVKNGNAPW